MSGPQIFFLCLLTAIWLGIAFIRWAESSDHWSEALWWPIVAIRELLKGLFRVLTRDWKP